MSAVKYLLAIDTAGQQCAVSLCAIDGSLEPVSVCQTVGNRHAECLLGYIDELLAQRNAVKRDIACVAFGAGPGGFTGLRVACGTAQGLGWALQVPVAPVNNLTAGALATARAMELPVGTRLAVMNDARMKEIYTGLYEVTDDGVTPLGESMLIAPADAAAWVKENGVTVVAGTAYDAYHDAMDFDDSVVLADIPEYMIVAMAQIGLAMFKDGKTVEPAQAAPLYVRDRVALTIQERARGERL